MVSTGDVQPAWPDTGGHHYRVEEFIGQALRIHLSIQSHRDPQQCQLATKISQRFGKLLLAGYPD